MSKWMGSMNMVRSVNCLSVAIVFLVPFADILHSEPTVVERNHGSLAMISSYHVRTTVTDLTGKTDGEADRKPDSIREVWCKGIRRKETTRAFSSAGPNGDTKSSNPFGNVSMSSVDDQETRLMQGWDPEHPFQLPLEFGRSAKEYGDVHCTYTPRDPSTDATLMDMAFFLWQPVFGISLSELSERATLVEQPQPNNAITRLLVESTNDPEVKSSVGSLLDIDHEHGFMLRRIETKTGTQVNVKEVSRFREAAPQIWVPEQVEIKVATPSNPTAMHRIVNFDTFEVNIPISDQDLKVQFPEGAHVIQQPELKYHVWGKEGPVQTFNNMEELMAHNYARARVLQYGDEHKPTDVPRRPQISWIIFANVILFGLLALVSYLRRRVNQSK